MIVLWRLSPLQPPVSLSASKHASVTSIRMWPSLHRKRFSTYPLWSSADRTSLLPAGCRVQLQNGSQDPRWAEKRRNYPPKANKYGRLFTKWDPFSCRRPTFATTFYSKSSINFELPDAFDRIWRCYIHASISCSFWQHNI